MNGQFEDDSLNEIITPTYNNHLKGHSVAILIHLQVTKVNIYGAQFGPDHMHIFQKSPIIILEI